MTKRGPFPIVLAITLFVMWLLLNNSLTAGHIVLGAILAIFFARTSRGLRPLRPSVKRLQLAVVLIVVVLADIIRSNIAVARVVLRGVRGNGPGFIQVPLAMRDPHGLAILAMIITATPGTVWVELNRDQSELTIHVLDLQDEEGWVQAVKRRYERPLMEIFE
ncbi:Na+/H+ antiporter subunit E [Povalibacter sp.]|uniref:Na+/H+ antiporter subunit E n=1 Tax=Povalibacter sp. TaxID=1962978 RepID=UPI002F40E1E9